MTIPADIRAILQINSPGKVLLEINQKEKTLKINKISSIFSLAGTFRPRKAISALKTRELFEKMYERK